MLKCSLAARLRASAGTLFVGIVASMSDDLDFVMRFADNPNRMGVDLLIRAADALNLGDRLFQNRLKELAKAEGWTDAALMIAEAANDEPLAMELRSGLDGKRPSAQIGDDPPFPRAIVGAAAQHRKIVREQDTL
jgi:hypothetical protein